MMLYNYVKQPIPSFYRDNYLMDSFYILHIYVLSTISYSSSTNVLLITIKLTNLPHAVRG